MKIVYRCLSCVCCTLLLAVTSLAAGEYSTANSGEMEANAARPVKNGGSGEKRAPAPNGKAGSANGVEQSGKGTESGEVVPLDAPDLRAHAAADSHPLKQIHSNNLLNGKTPSIPRPNKPVSTPAASAALHPVKSMPALPAPAMASAEAASMKKSASLSAAPMALAELAALHRAESPHANHFPPPAPVSPAPVRNEQKPVGETAFDHAGAPMSLRPGSALGGTAVTAQRVRTPALAVIGGNNVGNGPIKMKGAASINGSAMR
jgi:hypothetical protein